MSVHTLAPAARRGWKARKPYAAVALCARRFHNQVLAHDYHEEVYVVSGDLIVGNDDKGEGGEAFAPNIYACSRPEPCTARSSQKKAASFSKSTITAKGLSCFYGNGSKAASTLSLW
jgi:hypothetical protein